MIVAEGLTKTYGDIPAVRRLDFEVRAGEVVALVGTSGCGKSTTLKMINRLIEPSAGRILVNGVDTASVNPEKLRLGIGYAIQGAGLFPHWNVADNIATVPRLLGWDKARIDRRVEELLGLLHLDPAIFARKLPHQLSGGQQQRVGVARAIAAEPAVLLMDEPFGALDPITRLRLQDEFLSLQKRQGITVVMVTHDMDEAFKMAGRVAVMDKGIILQFDTPDALVRRPAHPFVRELVGTQDSGLRLLSLEAARDLASPASGRWQIENGLVLDRERGAVEPVLAEESGREAASKLLWQGADLLPVVDAGGALLGEVGFDALRRAGRGEA
ncbi:MAG TPA: ABC transporter ATP-binding protein [Microvirga sp.]|jgi:osmoprotectant transport system ATP-binding protein|nr:ABC transporter ATP-binding protein [Microvirga sp.]